MSMLKAVLFDLDDTLFSTTKFAGKARRAAVRAMVETGLDVPEEDVLRELDEVITEFSSNYDHHFDKLLQRMRPSALEHLNSAVIVAAGVVAYHNTKIAELAPFDDVYPLLEGLRSAGIRTGIITHGWTVKQAEKIIRLGLLPYLDPQAIFISDQIGISKPNPKLYLTVLNDLALAPQEVMYVGDNLANDIAPPKSLGMLTTWARRAAKHTPEETGVQPLHTVDDFVELAKVLREVYGVDVTL